MKNPDEELEDLINKLKIKRQNQKLSEKSRLRLIETLDTEYKKRHKNPNK